MRRPDAPRVHPILGRPTRPRYAGGGGTMLRGTHRWHMERQEEFICRPDFLPHPERCRRKNWQSRA